MDFYNIGYRPGKRKDDPVTVYPDFKVGRTKDLMVRGRSFYAIWDEKANLWSRDEYDVQRLVDEDLWAHQREGEAVAALGSFSSNSWAQFRKYVNLLSDNSHELDESLTFQNTETKKEDYVSRRLPYSLQSGSISAYEELLSTLYDPSERAKLEWAIGAIISGDSKTIQKFLVLYGPAGAGKSTILTIIQWLFEGYYCTFDAKALTGSSNAFAMEAFRTNPLVAIQHDGDLSRIEDNTKLNSITAHEAMTMNEKFKPSYDVILRAFLLMGTNKPVKITDAKSGIIRRLIDVQPSGRKLSPQRYQAVMSQIHFELGAIAQHCLDVYRSMGRDYYEGYKPVEMMLQTDVFFNYIENYRDVFERQEGISLKQAYTMYKEYCQEALIEYKLPQYKFREELKNYFEDFTERVKIDGETYYSWYSGFKKEKFEVHKTPEEKPVPLVMDSTTSLLDSVCADDPAQYATEAGTPFKKWDEVTTTLKDLDTTKLHYIRLPENHIVIDFDLKNENGEKDAEINIKAASEWPPTYAEYSKGGSGIHLHYIYTGDSSELRNLYSTDIEIKAFSGRASLRRKLSLCNTTPIATISGGLPLKERKVINHEAVKTERGLRELIERNLRKEIHPGTKPSMDFIKKILDDAYASGLQYDVSDMKHKLLTFATGSTNQAMYCLKLLQTLPLTGQGAEIEHREEPSDERLAFYDIEVFPNVWFVNWKYEGADEPMHRLVNPTAAQVERILKLKLVGYNCRRYDNHIMYAATLGYDNEQLYKLSKRIIDGDRTALFGSAYNLSYVDVYDYCSVKQSLKKWEIELGLHHKELGWDWDKPLPPEMWEATQKYCDNDVISTEATHNARHEDYNARLILAEISGLPVNSSTQSHAAKIIFEGERRPQSEFIYTNLETGDEYAAGNARPVGKSNVQFPGYSFERGISTYRGEEVGEGGYVYSEPGMYENVALLDIASMHPTSIENLNLFGRYTPNFSAIKQARIAIKHGDVESAKKQLGGALKPFLGEGADLDGLAYALKIVINIVYGLTSAKFDNPFRDRRNVDNIVAKRGALFMIDLKHFVQEKGFDVAHIKTDSIKIPNATPEIIEAVMEFGRDYGYEFEHEATYEKLCLVNDAVYAAKTKDGRVPSYWTATGAQYQQPYVFKTLFKQDPKTHEDCNIEFEDLCVTKQVTTALYIDPNYEDPAMALEKDLRFVGKIGEFMPVVELGGSLLREKDGKFSYATGSKGHRWEEAEVIRELGPLYEDQIDFEYFYNLVDDAMKNLAKFGDPEWFLS